MAKTKKIVYHQKVVYKDGSEASDAEVFDSEEQFTSTHLKFKDIMFAFPNSKKIHLEAEGFEWKQYFDIEKI